MSLLNRPSAGLHNVLIVLYRCVLAQGPMPRAKLLSLCGPQSATEGKAKMPQKTLNTWRKLGLFEVRDDDTVRLSPALPAGARDPVAGPDRLPITLRELVFREENNANYWGRGDDAESEESEAPTGIRSADFTRGLCWCLALQPRLPAATTAAEMWNGVDALQQTTLQAGSSAFVNDTRWDGFVAWAPFLGFGWQAIWQRLVVDPTAALRQELPGVFAGTERMAQREFLDRLLRRLPVLDGGEYRREMEARLRPGYWEPPPGGQISASLSLALERLAASGAVGLEDRADADRGTLTGPGTRPSRTFSHVVYRGAAG
jgi:hypothetical protein